ncbi:hypothetical protein AB3X52_17775 [Nocardioides sp. DS6]|uniref:IS110 family transposase n=1 Tax=Nocardioides eburneus TaxID=3231482 RepID=A0ABV3T2N9_9ACTN
MTGLTDLREVFDVVIGVDTHTAAAVDAHTGAVLDPVMRYGRCANTGRSSS